MALSDNLVTYWQLEDASGSITDSVGTATGTVSGSVTYHAAGKNNFAIRGTSGTGAVSFGNVHNYTDTDAFSISLWFNYDGAIGTNNAILSKFNSYNIYIAGGVLKVAIPGVANVLTGTTSISTGTWYHAVLTHSAASSWNLYLNGSLEAGPTTQTGIVHDTSALNFFNESSAHYNGYIDEVGVWTRVLTSGEVTTLYNSGSGTFYPYSIAYTITAALGTFTFTGIAALFRIVLQMLAALGSFTLTGIAASLSKGYGFAADVGSFALTGIDSVFRIALSMIADAGAFTLTGIAATFHYGISIIASMGSFILTGKNVRFPLIMSKEQRHSTTLSSQSRNSVTLTPEDRGNI